MKKAKRTNILKRQNVCFGQNEQENFADAKRGNQKSNNRQRTDNPMTNEKGNKRTNEDLHTLHRKQSNRNPTYN